jgi:hypothetical protein
VCCGVNGLPKGVVVVLSVATNRGCRGVVLAFGVSSPSTRLEDGLMGETEDGLGDLRAATSWCMAVGVAMLRARVYAFVCVRLEI